MVRVPALVAALLAALWLCSCESGDSPITGDGDDSETDVLEESAQEESGWVLPGEFAALDPAICTLSEPVDLRGFEASFTSPASHSLVADRAFPLLVLMSRLPEIPAAMQADATLDGLAAARAQAWDDLDNCAGGCACILEALGFTPDESAGIATALGALDTTLASSMRASGNFTRYTPQDDPTLVAQAWNEHYQGLAEAFERFCNEAGVQTVAAAVQQTDPGLTPLFFEPLLWLTVRVMEDIGRDEAARYEPLADQENKAAVTRLASVNFDNYPFAAIVNPGQGPDEDGIALDPAGAERSDLGAARLKAGLAPFIITSGGHVHPDRTTYCEALQMKRYLMETHGIAEDHILIDPYARHTTTNLRNVSRLALRYGMPPEKPLLITSDIFQSPYIGALGKRCEQELFYQPWRSMEHLSDNDNCMVISPVSLHTAPGDPLDP